MGVVAVRYRDRPALWDEMPDITSEVWPEYNRHGDVLNRYWGGLYDEFPDYQFVLYDEQDEEVLAEGHTIPCVWDGSVAGLGEGINALLAATFEARRRSEPTALCALAAEIRPIYQGRRLAIRILDEMANLASEAPIGASDRASPS